MRISVSRLNASAFAGAVAVACAAVSAPAGAQQPMVIASQAEWSQGYDAAPRIRVQRSFMPTVSQEAIIGTEQAIARYREIAARGGWRQVATNQRLRLGSKGPGVVALRERLIMSGDLEPSAGSSPVFDTYVEAAVKRFQARHGLNATGVVNGPTISALNVPVETRLRQLEINLVRLRALSGDLGERYVIVNIPAALVETVEHGQVVSRHAAGVGKIDRQSPIMNAKITEINFNPFWTVPASIIRKDLIPKMREDPNYLTDNKIRVYNSQGQEVRPESINWYSDEATRYMFRQDPGADINSMGFVRINIPNPHGVYMHDTPAKGIFGDDFRFVSSGCVRVQNVRDYVTWLLKETPGWDRAAVDQAIASGERIDVRLARPVNVYWTYITAWASPDGIVQFRDDVYNRDGLGVQNVMAAAQAEGLDPVN
ncbi:L,D-transpeptidase family protein [Chelatococcus composti]|uniref:Murein L,D-transpeptidase YcbB/YkuD n=1 Tax=Chelatococcus composti TaxID=1743235 RepID=A0A841KBF9_9HYPH|nr:L,D-transpeptidase family protein [Chelatococcus composti]MBB6169625.1 murein L,D-transpeptidase YcbB/YkuD [Chelatococcus composti]MBS7736846.1 L,D-transpeptidase family protein [Chelatococcus composti]PZN42897.1 MAG: murein L,D-transpeptidase [Pseudomonadota bacterium]GGG49593.1 amidase [Chelatococcus composti]